MNLFDSRPIYPGLCGRGRTPTVRALAQGLTGSSKAGTTPTNRAVFVWNTSIGVSEAVVPYPISVRYDTVPNWVQLCSNIQRRSHSHHAVAEVSSSTSPSLPWHRLGFKLTSVGQPGTARAGLNILPTILASQTGQWWASLIPGQSENYLIKLVTPPKNVYFFFWKNLYVFLNILKTMM